MVAMGWGVEGIFHRAIYQEREGCAPCHAQRWCLATLSFTYPVRSVYPGVLGHHRGVGFGVIKKERG